MGTTAHGLEYPEDYSERADVPTVLEQVALATEAALVTQDASIASLAAQVSSLGGSVATSVPIGAVLAYGGSAPPTGWHLCDGSTHNSSALQAVIGTPTTPDLRDRFIVGAGSSYSLKATGGAATITLTEGQSGLRSHGHNASSAAETQEHTHSGNTGTESANHTHSGGTGGHSADHAHYTSMGGGEHVHQLALLDGTDGTGDGAGVDSSASQGWNNYAPNGETVAGQGGHSHGGWSGGVNADHSHAFTTGGISANHSHAFGTGGRSAAHTHGITVVAATGAAATDAHENRPPYYALTFIIKKA